MIDQSYNEVAIKSLIIVTAGLSRTHKYVHVLPVAYESVLLLVFVAFCQNKSNNVVYFGHLISLHISEITEMCG